MSDTLLGQNVVAELLRNFTYKPGWEFEVVPARPYDYQAESMLGVCYLKVRFRAMDSNPPHKPTMVSSRSIIPYHLQDEEQAAKWLLHVIMSIERHETEEWFKVRGEAPFDPHARSDATLAALG